MENSQLKLHIARRPGTFNVDVTFYREVGNEIEIITFDNKLETYTVSRYKVTDPIPYTFSLPENQYRDILKAFAKEAQGQGIETHDSYIKGKLEATLEHLTDTKKILDQVLPVVIFNKDLENLSERKAKLGIQ